MRSSLVFLLLLFFGTTGRAQISGCTDPLATNYNSAATMNDGSCTYPAAAITSSAPVTLSDTLQETSGLIFWNNLLWTHNDNTDTHIYGIDTASGQIVQVKNLQGVSNYDWEEIAQDDDFIYIGDFGNNGNGNRQDLHVLRIAKSGLGNTTLSADTIWFHYDDQTIFAPAGSNNTDFDCEAFIAAGDSLYLFSKQWISSKTKLYVVPKIPGNYTAVLKDSFDVQGLITGATYLPQRRTIALSGYQLNGSLLFPFVYLLYDFSGHDFFSGNKRKINISQPMMQMEGIATHDGVHFFVTNEKINASLLTITPKLQRINLSTFLSGYYQALSARKPVLTSESVTVFPNPAEGNISVKITTTKALTVQLQLFDSNGKLLLTQNSKLRSGNNLLTVQLPEAASGIYRLSITDHHTTIRKQVILHSR